MALQFSGQGADDVDALDPDQQADQLQADLRLTARHGLSDLRLALRSAGRDELRFRLELGADAQLVEGLFYVCPAGGAARRAGVSDRFGIDEVFLDSFDRADLRF